MDRQTGLTGEQPPRGPSQPTPADLGESALARGNDFYARGRFDEAAASYREALRLDPDQVVALSNLAAVLAQQGQLAEAEASLRRALELRPDHAEAWSNLGNVLRVLGRIDEAIACYRAAVRVDPDHVRALYNLGTALADRQQHAEAVPCFEAAIRLQADHVEAQENLGASLSMLRRPHEALRHYEEALRLQPGRARSRWNRAMCRLSLGDYAQGWPEFEWRWGLTGLPRREFPRPEWEGAPLDGRTILLHAEQGMGDTFQFIRYARLVHDRGGRVLVACQRPLLRILEAAPGIDQVVEWGGPLPDFDVHCALMSLPRVFETRLETIPADVPYLGADPSLVAQWRRELESIAGYRVGICWAGNPQQPNDRNRSTRLAHFAPLAEVPGIHLVSLQVGPARDQVREVMGDWPLIDLGGRLDDFAITAAVIRNLDLVVSIDSAVAHLAGALGAPVWVALSFAPDWRWLLDREDSPWYPTARLFRQARPGGWDELFQQIAAALPSHVGRAFQPDS
jgi:Tfp pilus assembly protein PilF